MRSRWREVAIGELAEIFDGPHATPDKTAEGPIFLGISNLVDGRLDLSDTEHLSEEDYARWTRRVEPIAGDVVFSYETRLGEAAIIPSGLRCCLGRRMGLLRAKFGKVENRFLLYAYLGPQFQEVLRSRTVHGSTVDRIPLIEMPEFPIKVPDTFDEQHAIAGVLGALDDKIEQNRRTARAVKNLALGIFRAWFADFEPVKAKAAGATDFPSVPQHVFDALPTRFVDSEIRPVPEGWSVGPLSSVCTIVSGGTPKRSEPTYWDGNIPWYSIKDAPVDGGVWVINTSERITEDALVNSAARLVPKGCTIISARGTVGKLAIAGAPMAFNQSCYGLLPSDETSYCHLYLLLQTAVADLQQRTHGSVFDTITLATFDGLPVVSPPGDVVAAFEAEVNPLFELLLAGVHESSMLAKMRDYLLPKLLSGQVRLDVENG